MTSTLVLERQFEEIRYGLWSRHTLHSNGGPLVSWIVGRAEHMVPNAETNAEVLVELAILQGMVNSMEAVVDNHFPARTSST